MASRGVSRAPNTHQPVRFADVLAIRTFAVLYGAEAQSVAGDQLARVALSVLVYARTGSTAETAATYAFTFLPAIIGGGVLSGVADRYSRRTVMVVIDLIRAVLIGGMALSHLPLWALALMLIVAVFLGPAYTSAELSVIAGITDGEQYRTATGLRLITNQISQVVGFAIGGGLVAAIGSRTTLALDALTYLVSALAIGLLARVVPNGRRRAEAIGRHRWPEPPAPRTLSASLAALWQDRTLRSLLGLSWLAGFFVAPEGLAVPYARALGGGSGVAGALLTTIPLGAVIGAMIVLRGLRAPERRHRLTGPMAVLSGVPLIACFSTPPLAVSLLLWTLSGVFTAYQLDAMTTYAQSLPDAWRGRGMSVLTAGLIASQGLGLIVFGLIAQGSGPGRAVAIAGLTGSVAAALLWSTLTHQHRQSHATR